MIDWNRHKSADYATVTFFDEVGKAVGFKRFDRPTQTKTVADAVKRLGKQVLSHEWDVILYGGDSYYPVSDNYAKKWEHQIICTRDEFEAYVKEQEGEKWTHTTPLGDKCYIKDNEQDCEGVVLVVVKNLGYDLMKPEQLKPIKPTISAKEAIDMMSGSAFTNWTVSEFMQHLRDDFELEG